MPSRSRRLGVNTGFTATQTYTYDSLNRLNDAKEMIGSAETWKQTLLYDRYGNRTFDTTLNRTTTIPTGCPTAVCNPSADTTNNKLVGYQFDAAGNRKQDAESRKFTYDAENKQVKVETVDAGGNSTGTIGEYFYDGDGKRIKKYVPSTGETTIFVYDAAGKLVAEYATIVASTNDAKVAYLTNDHLGSPRITTDAIGQTISRHDYHPFGEEIVSSQRTSALGYTDDTVRKQFTGYERDIESSLDYAKARMFGYSLGRFTSPDPLAASAKPGIPQSWNRYVYVLNNPLVLTDPTGMVWGYYDEDGKRHFHWFSGKAGKFGGHTYSTYDGPSVISNTNAGRQIRLLDGGGFKVLKALPASTVPTSNSSRSSTQAANPSGGGYVNNALIKSVADESVKKGTTVAIGAGVAVAVGTGAGVVMAATGTAVGGTVTTLGLAEAGAATVEGTGAAAVTFTTHGAVHAATEGFSEVAAESAIRAAVQNIAARAATTGEFWGEVSVGGTTIVYRAFTLADGTIRIGTYYDPTKK